jgi:hypothetical protein
MKNIPIVILNKDRLTITQKLVESLQKRNYNNITIIDNRSSYPPLLEWYKKSGVEIFFNKSPKTCTGSFYYLAFEFGYKKFMDIIMNGDYIYTDSDTVPIDETPEDFLEDLVEIVNKYQKHKIGMGLKIDDLPDCFYKKQEVINHEGQWMWGQRGEIKGEKMPVYIAATDTTFAVYRKGGKPLLGHHDTGVRSGYPYLVRHLPWYYDYNNLPEDEIYYIKHLDVNWTHWSQHAKTMVKE